MRGLIATVVVVGVIAGAFFLFRDRLSGAADDLRVGDCFTEPAGETVQDVQHQPCTETHDGEVYFIAECRPRVVPASCSGSTSGRRSTAWATAFESYVGSTAEERLDIDVGYFAPTREGWEGGDREMTCYLTPADWEHDHASRTRRAAAPAAS